MELAGLVGKPNVGKSTLFSALTLVDVPIANYPFTTKKPNRGVTYLRFNCVCKSLGVKDNPKNSLCIDGVRLIPIQIIDCPGIVPQAHLGRGLGLQFLDEIRQASSLIVVADASGGTDIEGNLVEPGTQDPVEDVRLVERELSEWLLGIISKDWPRIARAAEAKQATLEDEVTRIFSGLGIEKIHVESAINRSELNPSHPTAWKQDELRRFVSELRSLAKPLIVAANKADMPTAQRGIKRLMDAGYDTIPCSAEAERTLRIAAERGYIRYRPGDKTFTMVDESRLTQMQRRALERIAAFMEKNQGTGVQNLIDKVYLEVLGYVPVFPVEDPTRLSDRNGNVLPDVYLLKPGSGPRELAYKIHTELGEGYLYAIDARTKLKLAADYVLKPGDVISIVSAAKRGG
ncbi:MAG: redox-regulated ATPase YchF [Nitrososphaerota archaeon]